MKVPEEIEELLYKVPRPPNDTLPAGISDQEIDEFAGRANVDVPDQLRAWLNFTNAPCVGPGGMMGINAARSSLDIEKVYLYRPSWRSKSWIPVAGDGLGNFFLSVSDPISTRNPIAFFDHEVDGPEAFSYFVASDLWHFLRFLFQRELGDYGWPFDRKKVAQDDPEILSLDSAKLPWTALSNGPIED
jgi:hypothetical protein